MPYKDVTHRSLDSRRRYLQQTLNLGGYQLSSKRRRPLTEDERETKQVDDRCLLDDEFKQNLVLVSSLLEDDARKDMEAEVERLTNLLSLAPEARSAALAESTPPSPEQLPTPSSVPATTDARPAKKQKVALSSPEQAPYQAPEQAPCIDAISLGSQTWQGLPKEDRAPYQEKAKAAKKQYDQDRKAFTHGGRTMKKCKTRKDNKNWELYFTLAADPNALAANLNGSLSFKCNKGVATRIQGKQSDSQNDLN